MNNAITLTPGQAVALEALTKFANREADFELAVLQGYAGTGKSTLMGQLLSQYDGGRVALAAPTNKAVRVLKDRVAEHIDDDFHPARDFHKAERHDREYGSIHSLLGMDVEELEDGTIRCKSARDSILHEYDLVIVDECSMLDEDLVNRILLSRRSALILFVGDPAQLPPVQGTANTSPVFDLVTYRITLTEVVRQAADNPIIKLSIGIRQAMERGEKISAQTLAGYLPMEFPAKAGLMTGGADAALSTLLYEIGQQRDARIVAFRNDVVLMYNRKAHEALHGLTRHPFSVGERVIAHQAFSDWSWDPDSGTRGAPVKVINSEELEVIDVQNAQHPFYRDQFPCSSVGLRKDDGVMLRSYVADDPAELDRAVSKKFGEWRQAKMVANQLEKSGKDSVYEMRKAKDLSDQAWALRNAFAPLRHVYAITAHKSQGSTFDTAIVDYADLALMRSASQFNRALYVAATRAREHLAVVV